MKKQQFQPLAPPALYARVSSDRQDVDLSVAAQLRALKEYAKNNGYSVAREYVDEAESGRVADRAPVPPDERRGRQGDHSLPVHSRIPPVPESKQSAPLPILRVGFGRNASREADSSEVHQEETAMPRESLLQLVRPTAFGLGLLLALSVALAAGCVAPQPTPEAAPNPNATMAAAELPDRATSLPTHTPAVATPPYDIPHGRLLAYQDHVGEFGGILYEGGDRRGTMHIYLTEGNFDPALIPEARERFDWLYGRRPVQKIVVHRAQYPWRRLQEWSRKVIEASARDNTLGITSGGLSERLRLITLNAAPRRGNRERIEAILASTDVPRDAVQVNIGCDRTPDELTAERGRSRLQGHLRLLGRSSAPGPVRRDRGPETHYSQPDFRAGPHLRRDQ